jgi:hypothetical protein
MGPEVLPIALPPTPSSHPRGPGAYVHVDLLADSEELSPLIEILHGPIALHASDKKTQLDEIVARLRRLNPALATADLCKSKILVANDLRPFEPNSEYLHD